MPFVIFHFIYELILVIACMHMELELVNLNLNSQLPPVSF